MLKKVMTIKRFNIKYVGYVFVVASLYFIAHVLGTLDINAEILRDYVTSKNIYYSFVSLMLYVLVIYMGSLLWVFALRNLSGNYDLPIRSLVRLYSKSNLAKYLPGNIMHYVARNVLAKEFSLSHKVVATTSFLEIAFILISGALLLVLIDLFSVTNINVDKYSSYLPSYDGVFASLFIVLMLLTAAILFRKKISLVLQSVNFSMPDVSVFCLLLVGYVSIYIILGVSQLLVVMTFSDIDFTLHNYWNILFVFIFSWIIGFVMPGSPGGIGVREAVFIFLLSQAYADSAVVLAAIFYRLINIFGDVVFYLLTYKPLKLIRS